MIFETPNCVATQNPGTVVVVGGDAHQDVINAIEHCKVSGMTPTEVYIVEDRPSQDTTKLVESMLRSMHEGFNKLATTDQAAKFWKDVLSMDETFRKMSKLLALENESLCKQLSFIAKEELPIFNKPNPKLPPYLRHNRQPFYTQFLKNPKR